MRNGLAVDKCVLKIGILLKKKKKQAVFDHQKFAMHNEHFYQPSGNDDRMQYLWYLKLYSWRILMEMFQF